MFKVNPFKNNDGEYSFYSYSVPEKTAWFSGAWCLGCLPRWVGMATAKPYISRFLQITDPIVITIFSLSILTIVAFILLNARIRQKRDEAGL